MAVPDRVGADDICVLMPVHTKTAAEHLREALDSLRHQTLPAREVLLVVDGPLTPAHDLVIAEAESSMPELTVLRLAPVGLVDALNAGLDRTSATWIARMDADDLAEPTRLELQARAAAQGTASVIGTAMLEFAAADDRPVRLRRVPADHDDIVRRLRIVNPMNHPTVLMRRDAVMKAGGYLPLAGMEDYYLWARLAAQGVHFRNLPQPLVRFRVTEDLYRRRADGASVRAEWRLQHHLRCLGLAGPVRSRVNLGVRVAFRLLPPTPMRLMYPILGRILGGRRRAD